jgi:hypothetical protein
MDPAMRRALSAFYLEEFRRHLDHLKTCGETSRSAHQTCTRVMSSLDDVCGHAGFPAVAETLLQNFDTLTHLSEINPSQGH